MKTDLVLLSGGLDSTTALAQAADIGAAGATISIDYGQRHRRELEAAARVAEYYGLPNIVLDLTSWGRLLGGSSLTDPSVEVPHGHYADPSMSLTVVPNRNATLLMAAAGVAWANELTRVVTAVHAGDHPVYPDCRPEFIDAARHAMELGTEGRVTLHAPFVTWTKTEIAAEGHRLHAPLGLTWSCYEGGGIHCGKCGTCTERIEAFREAGISDPTVYVAR